MDLHKDTNDETFLGDSSKNVKYSDLHINKSGKVTDKWESYLYIYDLIYSPFQELDVSILEIGVQNGGSLEVFDNYFKNAVIIVGCDINPKCAELSFESDVIRVVVGDIMADKTIQSIKTLSNSFNLIIDDGSHDTHEVINTFLRLYPLLKNGGLYIIEDLHCSYFPEFGGGLFRENSSINFLKNLIDIVNCNYWEYVQNYAELFKNEFDKYTENETWHMLRSIKSIEFHDSICIIRKAQDIDDGIGRRIVKGNSAVIDPVPVLFDGVRFRDQLDRDNQINVSKIDYAKSTEFEIGKEFPKLSQNLSRSLTELESEKLKMRSAQFEIFELQFKLMKHEYEYSKLTNSRSWKITRPLRWVLRKIKN